MAAPGKGRTLPKGDLGEVMPAATGGLKLRFMTPKAKAHRGAAQIILRSRTSDPDQWKDASLWNRHIGRKRVCLASASIREPRLGRFRG